MAALVMVMGDIGRSPRMMNHACMLLSRTDYTVHILAYHESQMYEELERSPRVRLHSISPPGMKWLSTRLFLLYAFLRILLQTLQILFILCRIPRPKVAIVQNPPAIPGLALLLLAAFLRNFPVWVDWHNYGYTLLQVAGRRKLVPIARMYEKTVGGYGDRHFCVSDAMRLDLQSRFSISAKTLYDRPPARFRIISQTEREEIRRKFNLSPSAFVFITCTSWTPDEHFDLLLNALYMLDCQLQVPIVFLITGKGPLKSHYSSLISKRNWRKVTVRLEWAENEEYPIILSACDVGVSLHASSSGVDLPMKVVDMIGAGLPVLSLYYPTVRELIKEGINGEFFIDENTLTGLIFVLLEDKEKREKYRNAAAKLSEKRWEAEWDSVVLPLLSLPHQTRKEVWITRLGLGLAVLWGVYSGFLKST